MTAQKLASLPDGMPWHVHRRFHRAAQDIAALADGLLQLSDSPLMAVALPSDGWGPRTPVLLWDQRLAPCADRARTICGTPVFGPTLDALCLATDDLFECLREASICPADALGLSVVTDGTGVALTVDTPCPDDADAGWLLDLVGEEPRAVIVLPLATEGVWALLEAETGSCAVH